MAPNVSSRRTNWLAPLLLVTLAFSPFTAWAGSAEGALSVRVEVVESCRVAAPEGLGTELVPCPTARDRGGPARAAAAPARAAGPLAARAVVERGADGVGYLTTIY
jgi:hypothetical protein